MKNTDFTKDRKSGFINILGLIESDIGGMSGENGILVTVSIGNIRTINALSGRAIGDIHVYGLITVLNETLQYIRHHYPLANIFRVSANEYIIMVPYMPVAETDAFILRIHSTYDAILLSEGQMGGVLAIRHVAYGKRIPHASYLIKWSNKAFLEPGYTSELTFEDTDWSDMMIERTLRSFNETLSLLREVDTLSLSDEVSKLPNHRAAIACLTHLQAEFSAQGQPYCVLFIDGDNLKRYNQLGYQHGNKMIEGLAGIIARSIRNEDQVFRWLSGDEFLVCLPDCELNVAMSVAERIRATVEQDTRKWEYPVTISIGVANCPDDSPEHDMLVQLAEKSNAHAKATGKNRVSYLPTIP